MKRIIGLVAVLMLVLGGMFSTASAFPGANCGGNVDAACKDTKDNEDPADDEDCLVYVAHIQGVSGCYNA